MSAEHRQIDSLLLACFNKALILSLHFAFVMRVLAVSMHQRKKKRKKGAFFGGCSGVSWQRCPGVLPKGGPADNYKPFSKHSSAAHGDILTVSQKTNRSLTRQRQRNTAYVSHATASTRLETRIESCKDNKGSLDSLKRMAIERGEGTSRAHPNPRHIRGVMDDG